MNDTLPADERAHEISKIWAARVAETTREGVIRGVRWRQLRLVRRRAELHGGRRLSLETRAVRWEVAATDHQDLRGPSMGYVTADRSGAFAASAATD